MTSPSGDPCLHAPAQSFEHRRLASALQRSTPGDLPTERIAELGRYDWTVARAEIGTSLDGLVGKGPCMSLSGVACSHRTLVKGGRQTLAFYFSSEVLDPSASAQATAWA